MWGEHEKAAVTSLSQAEHRLLLTIATTITGYDIRVNEAHLYSSSERVPPQDVKRFGINQQSKDEVSSHMITQVLVTVSYENLVCAYALASRVNLFFISVCMYACLELS